MAPSCSRATAGRPGTSPGGLASIPGEATRSVDFAGPDEGWAVADGIEIEHTGDGGATWYTQLPWDGVRWDALRGLDFATASCGWVATVNGLLHTADGGLHWTVQPAPVSGQYYDVTAVSPKIAWAVGDNVVIRTTDGGDTWTRVFSGDSMYFRGVSAIGATTAWAGAPTGCTVSWPGRPTAATRGRT